MANLTEDLNPVETTSEDPNIVECIRPDEVIPKVFSTRPTLEQFHNVMKVLALRSPIEEGVAWVAMIPTSMETEVYDAYEPFALEWYPCQVSTPHRLGVLAFSETNSPDNCTAVFEIWCRDIDVIQWAHVSTLETVGPGEQQTDDASQNILGYSHDPLLNTREFAIYGMWVSIVQTYVKHGCPKDVAVNGASSWVYAATGTDVKSLRCFQEI